MPRKAFPVTRPRRPKPVKRLASSAFSLRRNPLLSRTNSTEHSGADRGACCIVHTKTHLPCGRACGGLSFLQRCGGFYDGEFSIKCLHLVFDASCLPVSQRFPGRPSLGGISYRHICCAFKTSTYTFPSHLPSYFSHSRRSARPVLAVALFNQCRARKDLICNLFKDKVYCITKPNWHQHGVALFRRAPPVIHLIKGGTWISFRCLRRVCLISEFY